MTHFSNIYHHSKFQDTATSTASITEACTPAMVLLVRLQKYGGGVDYNSHYVCMKFHEKLDTWPKSY
jgi:hypothetical protein